MATILLTGGAGYIGSHCTLALIKKGFNVIILDSLVHGHEEIVNTLMECSCKGTIIFERGDILSSSDLDRIFTNHRIDAIIHFAAFIDVNESVQNPEKYYKNNVDGSKSLFDAAIKHNITRVVFSSSAAVYGRPEYVPIDEDHPMKPINPYGETKLLVEHLLDDYSKKYNLHSARLRYFNVVGASTELDIGEWHVPETHLIPNILRSIVDDQFIFKLFGTDYETRDGTCIRDYVNIEDLADAHLLALDYLLNNGKTDSFNIGTEKGSTVMEIIRACETITGKKIKISEEDKREGDPPSLIANHRKAERILGWKPKKTLKDSIIAAYKWQCKRKEKYGE